MVSLFDAVILSIIQGITEWFPISSSGHLALTQEILGFQSLGFDVYLHFASVFSVVIVFWKDIKDLFKINRENMIYIRRLVIAIIPAALVGLLLIDYVRVAFGSKLFIGLFFIIFGFFIYATKFAKERWDRPSKFDSFIIGISQVFALFPGVSRSGMTVGSGLITGLKKESAIKFSFLLAIPMILGATMVEAKEIVLTDTSFLVLLTSFTLTLFTSLMTIKLLVRIIKSDNFYLFGIYNILLGLVVVVWSFWG
jgi:undecaprenyl-diphosphatase